MAAVEWFDRLGRPDDEVLVVELAYAPQGRPIRLSAHGARHAPAGAALTDGRIRGSMALVVQKYGGTSVADVERIRNVAHRVARGRARGDDLVVVVSAMAGETNRLLALAPRRAAPSPTERECDVLVATGEQVTAALLAIALARARAARRVSFLGHQVRIATDSAFGKARIQSIDDDAHPRRARRRARRRGRRLPGRRRGRQHHHARPRRLRHQRGRARRGAQGRRAARSTPTSTASTPPTRASCPDARKLDRISYDEMLELASLGAKVLQIRSVEFAKHYDVPVHVRSSFNDTEGTWVVEEEASMEDVLVSGVTYDRNEAKITRARRARPAGHRGAASSARSPTPTSSST